MGVVSAFRALSENRYHRYSLATYFVWTQCTGWGSGSAPSPPELLFALCANAVG